jgi:hypothetical protein
MKIQVIALVALASAMCGAADGLLDGFRAPPRTSRPETWMQVSGGNASKEGMTLDLEAIAEAGFGGIQLFHESFRDSGPWPGVTNPIPCMSANWNDFIGHVGDECRRLNLRFLMHSCPGWSMAGGPWVPVDKAMRELTISRAEVGEGAKVRIPRPRNADDHPWRDYHDIAVIAFPSPEGDVLKPLVPVAVRGTPTIDRRLVRSYYSDPIVVAPPDDAATSASNWWSAVAGDGTRRFAFTNENAVAEVEIDFGREVTARTLEISPVQRFNHFWSFQPDVTVEVCAKSREGEWRRISLREMPQSTWQDEKPISLALPTTVARHFKVMFHHMHPLVLSSVKLFSGARPDNWEAEGARTLRSLMPGGDLPVAASEVVDQESIIDLTGRLGADSALDWIPPRGKWTVLRIGNVNSGIRNHPAPPEATGWECDKLSTAGADVHYAGYIGKLTAPGGPLAGGKLAGFLMDSWECEAQNWTPGLDRTFLGRRGYGIGKWWPALFGYIVKGRRETSLFYRDWRETIGDLVFENFYGHLAARAHENGQVITYQTCGGDVLPADPMKHWKYADVPMCEFWRPRTRVGGVGSPDYKAIRPCVSAGHIYGKRRIAAEALTMTRCDWSIEYLRAYKADLDHYFAQGVTHMVFENYTHNPQTDTFLPPGASYSDILGTPFLRGQTWWPQMRSFTDYLSRCSYMLEQGRHVADVLLYLGDRVDHKPRHHLPFPAGLAYDYLNRDALLSRIEVKDGLWTTPEGLTWKALWIYDGKDLRPETVAKFAAAEKKGGRIIRGDIFKGTAALGLRPQVKADARLLWQHRKTDAEEIYFFADEDGEPFSGKVSVQGVGEVLVADPVSGKAEPVGDVSFADGYATFRLVLGRAGARFVVVRNNVKGEGKVKDEGLLHLKPLPVDGEWTLTFPKGWGRDEPVKVSRLVSWHELPVSEEARNFSGTVTYSLDFDADAKTAKAAKLTLDLGRVETAARVRLNGRDIGLAWTWPYEFDATGAVVEGRNRLEVDVTGTWFNRLRYDAAQPKEKRKTWTLGWPDPATTTPQDTGLFGPVRLVGGL